MRLRVYKFGRRNTFYYTCDFESQSFSLRFLVSVELLLFNTPQCSLSSSID